MTGETTPKIKIQQKHLDSEIRKLTSHLRRRQDDFTQELKNLQREVTTSLSREYKEKIKKIEQEIVEIKNLLNNEFLLEEKAVLNIMKRKTMRQEQTLIMRQRDAAVYDFFCKIMREKNPDNIETLLVENEEIIKSIEQTPGLIRVAVTKFCKKTNSLKRHTEIFNFFISKLQAGEKPKNEALYDLRARLHQTPTHLPFNPEDDPLDRTTPGIENYWDC